MSLKSKTVRDACDIRLKDCTRNNLERATLRSYKGHVDHHIDKTIGNLLVTEFSRSDVWDFLDALQDEGLSRAMVKKVLGSLRAAVDRAVQREWVDQTWCETSNLSEIAATKTNA